MKIKLSRTPAIILSHLIAPDIRPHHGAALHGTASQKALDRMGWGMVATNGLARQDVEGEMLKGRADIAPVMKRRPNGCMGIAVAMDHRPVESERV